MEYGEDFKNSNILHLEISVWQKRWLKEKNHPDSLATTTKVCDSKNKPNLFSVLRIDFTWHVTSSK